MTPIEKELVLALENCHWVPEETPSQQAFLAKLVAAIGRNESPTLITDHKNILQHLAAIYCDQINISLPKHLMAERSIMDSRFEQRCTRNPGETRCYLALEQAYQLFPPTDLLWTMNCLGQRHRQWSRETLWDYCQRFQAELSGPDASFRGFGVCFEGFEAGDFLFVETIPEARGLEPQPEPGIMVLGSQNANILPGTMMLGSAHRQVND